MKSLLILFFAILFSGLSAQVVFCPPGAQWTANFTNGMWSTSIVNHVISYSGDTVIGADTLKLLRHRQFFNQCNAGSVSTFLKQKGDTVFIKNRHTQDTWQTLFNFACGPGQGWTFTYTVQTLPVQTYTYSVDSVATVIENGFTLRRLYLSHWSTLAPTFRAQTVVTERYAWGFLFQFQGRMSACDGDGFISTLCYSDHAFGTKLFTSFPCDYQNPSGLQDLKENSALKIYPSPCKSTLFISNALVGANVLVNDLFGRCILKTEVNAQMEISLSNLPAGIYLLWIKDAEGILRQQKIIKE